ncbi:SDR family NAD(P)-dependent oxidoreductase [Paenibacillus sp. BR2-3]|uniref:SDR family NAD(P)-dependent oxidoreductase n=1 Tax=Paenibacillus sp. BR2-3 TaxID=3048494 RepID=UPI00397734B0
MDALSDVRFSTVIKNSNYIVRDHRVHGVRIMPGVTLLDMIYRFLQTKGIALRDVELTKVLFSEPVSTSEQYDKKIQISFTKKAEGYLVLAQSQKVKDGTVLGETWDENLRCELHLNPADNSDRKSIDIHRIKGESQRVEDMDYAYGYVRKIDIRHRDFMKGLGKLYYGDQRILAEISLGELAEQYMDHFYMHPCYLDAATLVQGFVVLQDIDFSQEIHASIPMFIESFRSYEPMKEKIYVYIKDEGYPDGAIKDLMYFDIEVYNAQGEEIASFKRWGLKKIRSRELISKLQQVELSESQIEQPKPQPAVASLNHTVKAGGEDAQKEAVITCLKQMVSSLSEVDEADIQIGEGFYNQGLHSQDLLNIVNQLEQKLGTSLYPTLLFEYANIEELSQYILSEHRDSFFKSQNAITEQEITEPKSVHPATLCYAPHWEKSQPKPRERTEQAEHVLVFCQSHDELYHLAGKSESENFSFVLPGEQFAAGGNHTYRLNLSNEADYMKLVDELKREDRLPAILVNSLNAGSLSSAGLQDLTENRIHPMFYMLRELLRNKIRSLLKVMYFYDQEWSMVHPGDAAMEGFLHCIQSETDKVAYKCIGMDATHRGMLADIFYKEAYGDWANDRSVWYEQDNRRVKGYRKVGQAVGSSESSIRKNHTYLITGGTGGIGINLAEHILNHGGKAVLCGRGADTPEDIKTMQAMNKSLDYVTCDVTDRAAVDRLHVHIKEKYGKLDGIIHCAGLTRDSYLVHKEKDELEQVLQVKIDGTVNIDEVFKDEPLEFFVVFSSVAGILGNPGQSDYAYANLYMDGYMLQREAWKQMNLRSGKSLAVNWPLWKEGGMKGDSHTEQTLKHRFGISLLETAQGIEALEWALKRDEIQMVILPGEESKIDSILLQDISTNDARPASVETPCVEVSNSSEEDDLAIIGISGRFPGADNLFEYWDLLKAGRDCISEVDPERWSHEEVQQTASKSWNKNCSKWGGFIRDVDKFDSLLFNVAPYQAVLMDPHERVFLELAWEAFEDGGYVKSNLKGKKVGVFAGAMWMQYQLYNNSQHVSTSTLSSIANRVSYYFGLTGPSLGIDTMCSSSMTALHLACQSVKSKDCAMALVGGVNLSVHPDKYLLLTQGNFASSDGRCRSFGEGGDGYVPAEAAGAILIKPLKQAEKDNDRIYAVIKGSAINHGGEASGFTVPNQKAQEEAISEAIRRSGIDANSINYIEAHGTGTSLGDPIEIKALINAYQPLKDDQFCCAVGSVKSNIGHAEAAAGISSIAKVILQMKHGQLVPSIHSEVLNPHIRFGDSGFYVQRELEEWKPVQHLVNGKTVAYPRRAGISAFGAGGSNAHLILEQYNRTGVKDSRKYVAEQNIFVLSAQTGERLHAYAQRMLQFLKKGRTLRSKPSEDVTAALKASISELLNIPVLRISEESSISELGLGHVELIQLCESLNATHSINIQASAIAGDLTVQEVSRQISAGLARVHEDNSTDGTQEIKEIPLHDLAYTLQVGREPMKHRLAIIFASLEELLEQLALYLNHQTSDRLFTGEAGRISTENGQEGYGFQYCENISRLWTEGASIAWRTLYGDSAPEFISLPHYPFARKRYWIEPAEQALADMDHRSVSQKKPVEQAQVQMQLQPNRTGHKVVEEYTGNEVELEVIDGNVAIIRIQDAKHNNTFTHEVIQGFTYCFDKAQNNEQIKAIVVAGNDRIFSMGGTQEQLLDISDSKLSFTDAPILYKGMLECPIPVISAMEGHASGGGMLFGLYADIVVMAEESVYSAAFAKYGFTPGMGATFILEDKLGKNLATEMMFTAKMYTGEQLKSRAASVIFRKKNEVLQEAVSIARLIAEKPRTTVSVLKQELSGRVLDTLLRCVERENEMHRITFTTPEVKEKILHLYRASDTESSQLPKVYPATSPAIEEKQAKPATVNNSSPAQDVKAELIQIIGSQIQIEVDELDADMNFKDMGIDSISGVEIVRDINETFHTHLDTIDIYDNSTINNLAAHIQRKRNTSQVDESIADQAPDNSDRHVLELLSRLNEDELDVDEVAQFLEVYYE